MQTASAQERPDGDLQGRYAWGPDETAMVNAIIGAARDNQMSRHSGSGPRYPESCAECSSGADETTHSS